MNIKPLADRVLILPAPAEEKTVGGIIIPDTAKEKPLQGEVVAVGHGTKDEEMVPGAKANTEKQGPYFGKLTRFIQRLETKQKDKRLNFMFASDESLS